MKHNMSWKAMDKSKWTLGNATARRPAYVISEWARSIKCVDTTVASNVGHIVPVTEISSRVTPGPNIGGFWAFQASLRTERRILTELLAAIIGLETEGKIIVTSEASARRPEPSHPV